MTSTSDMFEIQVTEEFVRRYRALPDSIKRKVKKQEQLFRTNPFYPSLNTEKLEPKHKEVWSLRVDRQYRVLFRFVEKNRVEFLTIGPHDWIYSLPRL